MGACEISGTFKAHDWKTGINRIQQEAEEYYGTQDGYSGAENSCSFRYVGDFSNKTKSQIKKYIKDRMENMYKRDGEVIKVATIGYTIATTKYQADDKIPGWYRYMEQYIDKHRPATLLIGAGDWRCKVLGSGTIAEMKALAHRQLRSINYMQNVYIVTKNKKFIQCSADAKNYKKTTRKTDDKHLVLEYNEYAYYGWAAE